MSALHTMTMPGHTVQPGSRVLRNGAVLVVTGRRETVDFLTGKRAIGTGISLDHAAGTMHLSERETLQVLCYGTEARPTGRDWLRAAAVAMADILADPALPLVSWTVSRSDSDGLLIGHVSDKDVHAVVKAYANLLHKDVNEDATVVSTHGPYGSAIVDVFGSRRPAPQAAPVRAVAA